MVGQEVETQVVEVLESRHQLVEIQGKRVVEREAVSYQGLAVWEVGIQVEVVERKVEREVGTMVERDSVSYQDLDVWEVETMAEEVETMVEEVETMIEEVGTMVEVVVSVAEMKELEMMVEQEVGT